MQTALQIESSPLASCSPDLVPPSSTPTAHAVHLENTLDLTPTCRPSRPECSPPSPSPAPLQDKPAPADTVTGYPDTLEVFVILLATLYFWIISSPALDPGEQSTAFRASIDLLIGTIGALVVAVAVAWQVLVALVTALYFWITSSLALDPERQSIALGAAMGLLIGTGGTFFVVVIVVGACPRRSVATPDPIRRPRPRALPTIQVPSRDILRPRIQSEEPSATSPVSRTPEPGTAGSATPQHLDSQHPLGSPPLRGPSTAQPPLESVPQPPSVSALLMRDGTKSSDPAFSHAGYSPGGRTRHVIPTVEQTPMPKAWVQKATSRSPSEAPSPSATWGTSSENALQNWTFFLPTDRRMFGRVRKQSQDPRPIFRSPNCDVWKCKVEFSEPFDRQPTNVAVKVVRHYVEDERDLVKVLERVNARLNQEAITWAAVNHSNIVPLLGVIFSPIHALILPWYSNGNLKEYLRRYPEVNRLKLVYDISRGLEHLHAHTPKIVHADIKPENVLINDEGDALLTDFGMSTVLNEDNWYTPSHLYGGTYQWMAPEVLSCQSNKRSRTGDVYSFGSLTCYIMTDRMPHDSQSEYQVLSKMDSNNPPDPIDQWHRQPQLQDRFGAIIAGIIRRCWSHTPKDRPPMSSIVGELSALTKERESLVP